VVSGWLSWLSPLGWAQQARPFDADNWWVLAPILGLAGALIAAAAMLNAHRDVGTGMLSERAGPASAACGLLRPLGLAWRLQRGTLLAWATGMAVIGAALGGVGNELDSLIGDSDRSRHLIENLGGGGTQLADAYSAAMFGMLGIAVAGYAVSALLRMRSEETGGCLELLLSTSVRRTRWLLGHVAVVMFGALVLLTCAGLGFAVSYGIVTDDLTGRLGELLLAALIQLPAVLPVVGCAALAFGVLPRLVIGISWTVFTGCFAITELGDALDLPRGVVQLSPFSHVPAAPADDVSVLPLVVLTAIAVALVGLGGAGLRHRDLTA
ncbi:MAG TPA: anibiotic ABC transporter, partial [Mycobacteriales bacterium]|jgi:ABC-2 type transport system permease protein|nr:anibiotic ABC transporter [Mycobacteriales bacterium]